MITVCILPTLYFLLPCPVVVLAGVGWGSACPMFVITVFLGKVCLLSLVAREDVVAVPCN
jgi:hypothetical protein